MTDTPRVECAVEDHDEGEYCEYCPAPDYKSMSHVTSIARIHELRDLCCNDPGDCDAC